MTLDDPLSNAGSRFSCASQDRGGDPRFHNAMIRLLSASWKCRRTADGFTLVETLVVLALVATMTALMAVSISQVGKIREAQKLELEEMRLIDSLRVLKADLGSAISIPLISVDNADQAGFLGSANEINFAAYVPIGFRSSGFREVRYLLNIDKDGLAYLVREVRAHRLVREPLKDSDVETILLGAFETMRFEFRGKTALSGFVDSWRDRADFPSVVQVELIGGDRTGKTRRSIVLYP